MVKSSKRADRIVQFVDTKGKSEYLPIALKVDRFVSLKANQLVLTKYLPSVYPFCYPDFKE